MYMSNVIEQNKIIKQMQVNLSNFYIRVTVAEKKVDLSGNYCKKKTTTHF